MTRPFAPCVMSAWASASSVASLPCALAILNSDVLYPASPNAFVKYGRSELTHRVDEVVSGMITPTRPLPAACKSFSVAMAAKLTSKDETLREDGTVAGDAPPVVVVVPHAVRTNPDSARAGNNLANFIEDLLCFVLLPSSRAHGPGARVRRQQVYSDARSDQPRPIGDLGDAVESIAYDLRFVKN